MTTTKTCADCGAEKQQYKGGKWRCKQCYNARQKAYYHRKQTESGGEWSKRYALSKTERVAYTYNVTLDEAERLLNIEACEICGATDNLVVDHCHTTGVVRGRLCSGCNTALGLAGEDPDRLIKIAEYARTRCDRGHA